MPQPTRFETVKVVPIEELKAMASVERTLPEGVIDLARLAVKEGQKIEVNNYLNGQPLQATKRLSVGPNESAVIYSSTDPVAYNRFPGQVRVELHKRKSEPSPRSQALGRLGVEKSASEQSRPAKPVAQRPQPAQKKVSVERAQSKPAAQYARPEQTQAPLSARPTIGSGPRPPRKGPRTGGYNV